MSVDGFKQTLQDLKIQLLNKKIGSRFQDYPRVVFLGTGSCIPNKTRNTSGILFEIRYLLYGSHAIIYFTNSLLF